MHSSILKHYERNFGRHVLLHNLFTSRCERQILVKKGKASFVCTVQDALVKTEALCLCQMQRYKVKSPVELRARKDTGYELIAYCGNGLGN